MAYLETLEAERLGEGAYEFGRQHSTRQQRGWGEIACLSYGPFLDQLQSALRRDGEKLRILDRLGLVGKLLGTDRLKGQSTEEVLTEEELNKLKGYRFPVHALIITGWPPMKTRRSIWPAKSAVLKPSIKKTKSNVAK